jgi:hypothetical protein
MTLHRSSFVLFSGYGTAIREKHMPLRSVNHTFTSPAIHADLLVEEGVKCSFNVLNPAGGTSRITLSRSDLIAMANATGVTPHEMSTMLQR